jgi:hypothetical protein
MKLKIEATICILYENHVIRLQLNTEVIIVYDDGNGNGTWRFHMCYN